MQGGRASIQEKGGGAEWRRRPFYTTHLPLLQRICPYALPLPKNIAAAAGAEALYHIATLPTLRVPWPWRARQNCHFTVSYSLPSLRMLRRISCQETKNAAIR